MSHIKDCDYDKDGYYDVDCPECMRIYNEFLDSRTNPTDKNVKKMTESNKDEIQKFIADEVKKRGGSS